MNNNLKGKLGEQYVAKYLTEIGYQVLPDKINGSDLVVSKNGVISTIEVKTTENMTGGIPDMHDTEFVLHDGLWHFVADFLYIVRLDTNKKPVTLDILTKAEIDSFAESHKTITRIRTTALDRELHKGTVGTTIKISP
jgi:hypothetical protein